MVFTLALSLYLYKIRKYDIIQIVATFLLSTYYMLVLNSTVIGRYPMETRCELRLFWSYGAIAAGNKDLLQEVILNVVLFVPIGMLIAFLFDRRWIYLKGLLTGFLASLTVETLQLIMQRGLFELDDIFHNTLGCVIGVVISTAVFKVVRVVKKD